MDKLLLRKSANGNGVFSNAKFRKGEIILELHGRLMNKKQFSNSKINYKYGMQIGKDLFIGPDGEIDDFINHSCNPNAWVMVGGKRAFLIALKDIGKGREIRFDYSLMSTDYKEKWDCDCKSKICRRKIGAFKDLPEKVKNKYTELGIVPRYNIGR